MRSAKPILWKLMVWTGAIAVVCALDPDDILNGWVQTVPHLAAPATALGLTLITAANRDRK